MDTQPKIPTLKDSQKPQVKVRGLEAGVTLFDRLKQFKKKDLAFILAGLGTLFMAPLAEHFMMSPETGDGNQLQAGWKGGAGGKPGMFDGSGSSPYEPGTTGLAPGGAIGGLSDIITPLNVRDPSALVMGPGATQQPPTNSVMPSTPPPTAPATHSDSDLKDALAASARGVTAAAHAAKALLPIPKIALSGGSGLRGLGVVSGGSSASAGPISSGGLVSGKAAQGNNAPGVAGAKGVTVAGRGLNAGSGTSAMDALKAAGDKAAGAFNRSNAADALNTAAGTAIPTGGAGAGGAGAGGSGVTDKPDSGNSSKDGKTVGESLAFLKQKAMQEAQIALWAKEQEAGDNKLEALKIRNTMAESVAGSVASAVGGQIGCLIVPSGSTCVNSPGGAHNYWCNGGANGAIQVPMSIIATGMGTCQGQPQGVGPNATAATNPKQWYPQGNTLQPCYGNTQPAMLGCNPDGAPPATTPAPPQDIGVNGAGGMSGPPMTGLGSACAALNSLQKDLADPKIPQTGAVAATEGSIKTLLTQAQTLVGVRDAIGTPSATTAGGSITPTGDCLAPAISPITGGGPVASQLNAIAGASGSLLNPSSGIIAQMNAAVTSIDPKNPDLTQLATNVGDGNSTGVTGQIKKFAADVTTLQNAFNSVSQTTPQDPLGMTALHTQLGANWDAQVAATAASGAATIQQAAVNTGTAMKNLNSASSLLTPLLAPQTGLLVGSIGPNAGGTIPALVTNNQNMDSVGGAPGGKVPSPLTAPPLTPPQNTNSDGKIATMLNTDLPKAQKDISDTTTGATVLVKKVARRDSASDGYHDRSVKVRAGRLEPGRHGYRHDPRRSDGDQWGHQHGRDAGRGARRSGLTRALSQDG